jgi:D-alanyl-D-alanine carboxypeptidase
VVCYNYYGDNMKKVMIFLVIILVGTLSFWGYKYIGYRNSETYKLKEIGYSETEINTLNKFLKSREYVLNNEYDKDILLFIDKKHFKEDKLETYLTYYKEKKETDINKIITIINIGLDKEFYKESKSANTSKENIMLVNKYNGLTKDFVPNDLVDINSTYAYAGHKIKKEVYEALIEMIEAAKKDNIKLIVTSGYRSYESQEKLYKDYVIKNGQEETDKYAAKPGFSEHQTGLALDIMEYGVKKEDFDNSKGALWLADNAYKYGFILRYKKDTVYITGYEYESWHYRYVGKDLAKKVYNSKLTYEEYYEYYLK